METDLTQIIKSNQPLSEQHVQFFTYQILRGLKYLHSAGILHRDLKPRNLLVNSNCDLKICDFGLSRANIPYLLTKSAQMTDYISTRWYRAPEVILSQKQYTGAIDVWSVGCILAELITRKALLPAQNEHEQMQKINDLLGNPDQKLINQIEDRENKEFMLGLPKRKGQDFSKLFSGANPQAIDLIKKMLTYDPDTRITIEEALAHPFLEKLHCETEEPVEKEPVAAFDFDFELYSLRTQEFKELIYEEIQLYHSEEAVDKYMKNRKEHPNGILYQRFGKERMRTMYRTGVAPATEHDK
jgi:serine/threonine protein kinase